MSRRQYALKERVALEGSAGEECVLVDTHSATLCACNESAWIILNALKDGATTEEMVALIASIFAVDEGEAKRDALDFIHRLTAMGLIDEKS
jgi:Coenzyme PQQ synthesis protein D (PqqD)